MTIPFDNIPASTRVRGVFTEVDPSKAVRGLFAWPQKLLAFGQMFGGERVTNGDFGTDTDWTKGDGWSISGGKATCDGSQTGASSLEQDISAREGFTYVVKFTLSSGSAGTLTPKLGGTAGSPITALGGDGDYEIELVCGASDTKIQFEGDTDYAGSIDDVSVEEKGSGTATVATLYPIPSAAEAEKLFGVGSILTRMCHAIKKTNPMMELWAIAQGDGSAQAEWTVDFGSANASAAGLVSVLIGGIKVQINVASGDSPSTVATAFKNKCAEVSNLPIVASVASGVVTLLHRCPGALGGKMDVRKGYYGEDDPPGMTITITQTQAGSGNPDVADVTADCIAALGDTHFSHIAFPYSDNTNLASIEDEMDRRFLPLVGVHGHVYTAYKGTASECQTFGAGSGRNCPHVRCMPFNDSPSPQEIWAADYMAAEAVKINADPARPVQLTPLPNILPPKEGSDAHWDIGQRNTLLWNGVSTWIMDGAGRVLIDTSITMYRENTSGVPDPSYLFSNTMHLIDYINFQVNAMLTTYFPNYKVVDDGNPIPASSALVTPNLIKQSMIGLAMKLRDLGLIENIEAYRESIIVERNESDPTRVDIQHNPDLVNGLRIICVKNQFIN